MRFPWQRRADEAQADTTQAKDRLRDVRADWTRVRATVETTRRERELNGWTASVQSLFSGRGT
jgi:hypothetical protein